MLLDRFALWLAQGFGLGRVPRAPGTAGSIAGLLWFGVLVLVPSASCFFSGLVLSLLVSVAITGRAEELLAQKDPNSVVLDEIVAIPVCFAGWMTMLWAHLGHWPAGAHVLRVDRWPEVVGILVAFRVFDILKPWPVRQVQRLRGGWGITLDDLLAAFYVNLCVLALYLARPAWLS
ncbi:MAG: phosphatidylglycerophosphatase A [Verrucomicrobia bacterium]|nr:phosphatidylglycerophosphatase A [Verrucomicrobiota bacterium]